jgi:uncharacterized RDD family membrane protein YckC
MINPEVVAYVRQNMQAGVSPEQLRQNLLSNGWSEVDVNDVFREVSSLSPLAPGATPIAAVAPVDTAPSYASFFRRAAGHVIDGTVVSCVTSIIWLVTSFIFEKQILAYMTPHIDRLGALIKSQTNPQWSDVQGFFMAIIVAVGIAILVSTVVNILYRAIMESSVRQATLGKLLVGLKLTDLSNQRVSFGRALGRNIVALFSSAFLGVGYLMAIFTERKQTLHDKVAGTVVVDVKRYGAGRVFGVFVIVFILSMVLQQAFGFFSPSSFKDAFKNITPVNMHTPIIVTPVAPININIDMTGTSSPASGTVPENTPLEEGVDAPAL